MEVLFCDNHLLIANKPSDLLTQPTDLCEDSLETRLKEWLKKEFHKKGNVFLHCIHRLDRPVSGLVLFARSSKALSRLNEQSRKMEIQRIYIAEVEGKLPFQEGKLDHFLTHENHRAQIVKEHDEGAKHARLTYKVLQNKEHSTLVEIELETGRYHQIRAQFKAIGHPVRGDKKYGAKEETLNVIRLHCSKVCFDHPITKERMNFSSSPLF